MGTNDLTQYTLAAGRDDASVNAYFQDSHESVLRLLQIVFAYGAFNLRSWAWWLGIIATGLSVVGVLIAIIGSGGVAIWTAITNALVPIIIFVYLLLPDTRKAFGR